MTGDEAAMHIAQFHYENGLSHPDPEIQVLIEELRDAEGATP